MARVVLIVEDNEDGNGVRLDIVSDPPFPEDFEQATLAQYVCAEAANSLRALEDFTVHKYYH